MNKEPLVFCVDCEHHEDGHRCALMQPEPGISPVDGMLEQYPAWSCQRMRSRRGWCGPSGKLYEARGKTEAVARTAQTQTPRDDRSRGARFHR